MTIQMFLSSRSVRVLYAIIGSVLLLLSPSCARRTDTQPDAIEVALPTDEELQRQLDDVLDFTFEQRHLDLKQHAAWQILHGVLAYQQDFQVRDGDKFVGAVEHVLGGGSMEGWTMEAGNRDAGSGRSGLRAIMEPGSKTGQGHADQWLAVLAQCGLEPEQTIRLDDHDFAMADFVRQVEWDTPRNLDEEFSWTLIGLTAYRPTDYAWTAADGKQWSIERLLGIELDHDLYASACGGSHRLIGVTMALNRHLATDGKLEDVWQQADERIQEAIQTAQEFQNPNGSFSVNYFSRPGTAADAAEDIGSTGHTLEFLALAMTDEQLAAPWVKRSALHLCDLFRQTKEVSLECGALYHAIHGLALYRQRLFGAREYGNSETP